MDDNIKMNVKKMHWSYLGQDRDQPIAGSYEHDNEHFSFMKFWEFLE
jgi:hypothetical protein